MTQSGFLVGTPGYMAPEQASGKRALVGPATDIYALGVMLYQLLTGQLPFQRDSTLELLRAVTSDEPTRPRRLQPRLPRDLEAITLHCLEKEPAKRYASALELADDLRRFQVGEVDCRTPAITVRACGQVRAAYTKPSWAGRQPRASPWSWEPCSRCCSLRRGAAAPRSRAKRAPRRAARDVSGAAGRGRDGPAREQRTAKRRGSSTRRRPACAAGSGSTCTPASAT